MALKDRQKTILRAAVLEHIRSARPVASQDLLRSGFEVSPATIRGEMLVLDELGFLEQPHTSAGRVPTDKGYRFFVDHFLSEISLRGEDEELISETFAIREVDDFVKELSKTISRISDTFTAAGIFDEDLFYETGFSRILEKPELRVPESARMFGKLADLLDESVRGIVADKKFAEGVFIGRENPLKEAEGFSMFISSWQHPRGFHGFVTIIGPRRTNYSKHSAVIKSIKKFQKTYEWNK